ncbi:MAG: LVIVD repeat-containing protein [Gemmatimonadaceae bacterium]
MTSLRAALLCSLVLSAAACRTATQGGMQLPGPPVPDPRVGLRAGYLDAAQAAWNLELVASRPRPERFFDPAQPGSFAFANSDLAFSGNYVFQGGYNGIQIWDISDPRNPRLRSSIVCPGGQGDPSVYRNLLFVSVEETRGRLDCGAQGITDTVSAERFRGVRIFDISDIDRPRSVASVQTCRGSHTHTLVSHPADQANIYVYVSGTSRPRPSAELAGCSALAPEQDPNTSLFRIEVIRVPLAAPQDARIVNMPRIFANAAGNIAALWPGGGHGEGTQMTARTDQCHDITAYSAIGLAAGACSGNGILLDIRDPVNPRRIAEVSDPNFAYWHSATFNNDGTKVVFTDEWGGGTAPRCRATDRPQWGANAIYTLENGRLRPASFYKLPAPQTATENCVAHNGSLIPVPGRDIMVQAWYQGGVSVFDFTDPRRPVEIAFFDRGPVSATELTLAGHWSAYWYNGRIYASEIARGLDVLELLPSPHLSANEIEAAKLVRWDRFNAQDQQRIVWPASFVVARAYLDQLRRNGGLSGRRLSRIARELDSAQRMTGDEQRTALTRLAATLEGEARGSRDAARVRAMAGAVREIARSR